MTEQIPKKCLTCEYWEDGTCDSALSDYKGQECDEEHTCSQWSLSDVVRKIYECL